MLFKIEDSEDGTILISPGKIKGMPADKKHPDRTEISYINPDSGGDGKLYTYDITLDNFLKA